MPKYKFEEIEQMTTGGRLFPVYLIYGPEYYLQRILIDKIRDVYKAETGAEVDRYNGEKLDVVSVVDSLQTIPMWTKGSLVIIDNATSLSTKSNELLEKYVSSPSTTAILILTSLKFDGRSKLYKTISKSGCIAELKSIYEYQMLFWINRECSAEGYKISKAASLFMTELVGADLSQMSEAVKKIALYIGTAKKIIDVQDVEAVLSDTSQKSIFDLTNALGSRDLARADDRLINLLRNNEKPVVILAMLARHWRLLIKTRELLARQRVQERDLTKILGVHPFFAKAYLEQAKRFKARELVAGLKSISKTDKAIKSSKLTNKTILHKLLINLVN